MLVFTAPWIANVYLGKPGSLIPLQVVGLITPFNIIVRVFRGAFQGVYLLIYFI